MQPKVIIIDDNEDILYTFSAIADYADWSVRTAANGKAGLEIIAEWQPDLVIVDYYMPEMNGEEFITIFRKTDTTTPIMVLTVEDDQLLADRLLTAGATDFALKPLRAPDLISRVNLHIKPAPEQANGLIAPKGIGQATLDLIVRYLVDQEEFVSIEEVASGCNVSYPSAYRCLTYLEKKGCLKPRETYGEIGRPRRTYKWTKM